MDRGDDEEAFREQQHALAYAMPVAETVAAESRAQDRFLRAFLASALIGGLTSGLTGVPYFLELHDKIAMDWAKEGPLFFLFGCGIGATAGAGSMGGMLLVRRWLGEGGGVVRAAATVVASVLGVTILGTVPGSIGTAYFGAKQAPFMGLAAISVVPFAGALATSAIVARTAIRDGERDVSRRWALVSSVLALVPVCGAGVALALAVPDEVALAWLRATARDLSRGPDGLEGGLAVLGGAIGAALGAALGLHVGLTTIVAGLRAKTIERASRF